MAKFIINTAQTKALRLSEINGMFIDEVKNDDLSSTFTVMLRTTGPIYFEIANTLAEAKALAVPILAALEQ